MRWNVVYSRGTGRGSTFLVVEDPEDCFLVYEDAQGAAYLVRTFASLTDAVEWCRHAVAAIRVSAENAPTFGEYKRAATPQEYAS